jgi:SAM-dependent methyltransferase
LETIYNNIGRGYNSTRHADPYLTGRLLHFLKPGPSRLYLDIGCGTGNYTIALANKGLTFTGVEPSEEMLGEARARGPGIKWLRGTAEHTPVTDNTFDGVIATLTIHHWTNLALSFKEIYRVSKENAAIVFFMADPAQMKKYWLNHYFPRMLGLSIRQMPKLTTIKKALSDAGFKLTQTEKYFVRDDLADHFLYSGKNRPEIYFNKEIRKGISSFGALANAGEIEAGLSELETDLTSGKFLTIKNMYDDERGDYLFIVAEKTGTKSSSI